MEDHGQQGARHGGAALGSAAAGVAGRAVSLAPAQAGPAALARHSDLARPADARAAAYNCRKPRRARAGTAPPHPRARLAGAARRRARAHGRLPRHRLARAARAPAARRVRLPLLRAARGGSPHSCAQECRHLAHPGRSAAGIAAGPTQGTRTISRRGVSAPRRPRLFRERNRKHPRRGRGRYLRKVPPTHRPAQCRSEKTSHYQGYRYHPRAVKFQDPRRGTVRPRVGVGRLLQLDDQGDDQRRCAPRAGCHLQWQLLCYQRASRLPGGERGGRRRG